MLVNIYIYNAFLQDIIARFGKQEAMPREFFTDFVKDEGRYFTLVAAPARLEELGLGCQKNSTKIGIYEDYL